MNGEFFISHPRFAAVIALVLLIAGAVAAFFLPIADYPVVSPPVVMVQASYPGASAQAIADAVAAPIEAQINGVENLMYFTSSSANAGNYTLTATFNPGSDEDMALVNVNNAVKLAEHLLPNEVIANGVTVSKQSSDLLGYMILHSKNPKHELLDVSNYADIHIRSELARLNGMAQVVIYGEKKYAMRVWLDPERMRALGISVGEVKDAIAAQNIQAAAGAIGMDGASDELQFKIDAKGRLSTPEEFAHILVRSEERGMRQVRLGDIAKVELSAQAFNCNPKYRGHPAVSVAMYKLRTANAIELMKAVRAKIAELEPAFPEGFTWHIMQDQTRFVKASMREIAVALVLTLILVVFITWLFLRSLAATLIPSVMIPVSLVGTCVFLKLAGLSINTLTMFAVVLVIGSLVDNAICVTEGCMRLLAKGRSPVEATRATMKSLSTALVAATLVVVAVYAPIACAGGMLGMLYLQFSAAMCIALVLSLVTALTLAPALAARVLKPPRRAGPLFRLVERGIAGLAVLLGGLAGYLARHVAVGLVFFALVCGVIWRCAQEIPPAFVPEEDKGVDVVDVVLPAGSPQTKTAAVLKEIQDFCLPMPEVESVWTEPGYSTAAGQGENCAYVQIELKPWKERPGADHTVAAVRKRLEDRFLGATNAEIVVYTMPTMNGFGEASGVTFELEATEGQSPHELVLASSNLVRRILATGLASSAFAAAEDDTPVLKFELDRQKAEALGVSAADVFGTLQAMLGSYYVNDFNKFDRTYQVIVQASKAGRADLASLGLLHVTGEGGAQIPLEALGEFRWTKASRQIERFNMFSSTFMTAQLKPGVATGALMDAIEREVREVGKGWRVAWRDLSYHERQNDGSLGWLFALAAVMAYLFLVAQYESWSTPFAAVLPLVPGVAGGLLAMRFTGTAMDIYCQLGILMLVALSTKSAILMAEHAQACTRRGVGVYRAAMTGFRLRFRSVLMTALSFVIGVLPFLFATGAGAAARRSIGIVTFWGMLAATFVGVLFVPMLYVLFTRRARPHFTRADAFEIGDYFPKPHAATGETPPP